jgi:uncharacterized protein (TIGR00725 family)
MTLYIGVIGEAVCDKQTQQLAERVGRLLAESKVVLVCGGMGGVMEGASRGVKLAGGTVIGILPGQSRQEGNLYLTHSVVTGMGEGRNIILVRSCDAMIAIRGGYGTLSEIAFAHKLGIPIVGLDTWSLKRNGQVDEKIIHVSDANEAVATALDLARIFRQGETKSCV